MTINLNCIMKRIKINILILVIFLIIYFSLSYIYVNCISSNNKIYVLNKDVVGGQEINREDLKVIFVNKAKAKEILEEFKVDFDTQWVAKCDIYKGQILRYENLIKKGDYIYEEKKEIIVIELDKEDFELNSKLKPKNIVNLYFKKNDESNDIELVQEDLKLIDILKKDNENYKIMVSLSNDKIKKIKNNKINGKFSVSLIR